MVDTSKGAGQHPWAVAARALMDAATATSGAGHRCPRVRYRCRYAPLIRQALVAHALHAAAGKPCVMPAREYQRQVAWQALPDRNPAAA